MELRKKNLHMMQKKSEAQNQITFDEDYNVPDQKADIGQIIQKKGEVEIEQVQVSEGKAVIQGQLIFRLLYVADNPGHRHLLPPNVLWRLLLRNESVRWYHPALPVSPDMHPDTPAPGSCKSCGVLP